MNKYKEIKEEIEKISNQVIKGKLSTINNNEMQRERERERESNAREPRDNPPTAKAFQ